MILSKKFSQTIATSMILGFTAFTVPQGQLPVDASSVVIFSDDFSSYTSTSGTDTQESTGLGLKAFGTLSGWTATGTHVVHAVDREIGASTNWAYIAYDNNTITMSTGVAANASGTKYTVSFDIGPSVYAYASQASQQSDGFVVSVLRADASALTTSTQKAGVWDWSTKAQAMRRRSFTYTGDGTGNVKLKFAGINIAGRFNGAIDNVEIRTSDECAPTSSTISGETVLSFTVIGTCTWVVPDNVSSVRSLVVAGGGGGGGGGGGAGGLIATSSTSVSSVNTVSISVGAGGIGATKTGGTIGAGTDGANSAFGSITADGGGGGGAANSAGRSGGSSGGAGQDTASAAAVATSGFPGGPGRSTNGGTGASGGGGAGSAGIWGHLMSEFPDQRTMGGNGGAGVTNNITGTAVGYAGGGGGGANNNAVDTVDRGFGGGSSSNIYGAGDGSYSNRGTGLTAEPHTGSGGGGGDWEGGGGNGGSGVVIIRFAVVVPTTTTIPAVTTTPAPALDIVVVAPSTSVVSGTTVPVGQSQIPLITGISKSTTSTVALPLTATTTTVPTKSSGTVAPKAPSAPSVVAGSAAVKVGGKTEAATVERADNQLVVSAGALKAVVGGLNPDGSQMALDPDGNVRLNTGDTIRIKLAGFKPGAIMEAWLFSTPVLLGTAKVGVDGTVIGTFAVPKNITDGAHRVVVVAQTTDGKPATLAVGINVGEWDSGPGVAIWLIVLPIALAVVGALVVPAQRRRRRASLG